MADIKMDAAIIYDPQVPNALEGIYPTMERTNVWLSGTVLSALDPPAGCRYTLRSLS